MSRFEKHLKIDSDSPIVDYLSQQTGLPKQRIKDAMKKGAVWLERGPSVRRVRRMKTILQSDDLVHLYYDAAILSEEPPSPELIADQNAYSVWYKPYGMRSQGSKWGDHCTIHRWVEQHHHPLRPAFIVHRLDRAATGLILIAHQKRTATALARLFEDRKIEKRYRVIAHGHFPDKSVIFNENLENRTASSRVSCLAYDPNRKRSLLDIQIETGRKHQIRRHLSNAGFPVVGDRLYGSGKDTENLQLTARLLSFRCPIQNTDLQFELPATRLPTL